MSDGASTTPVARLEDLLEEIVEAYGLDASVHVEEDDEELRGTLEGEDLGIVIGRHGQTIDALQHLAARIALRGGAPKRVVVDAAGYRERRAGALERQADRAVGDAVRTGKPVALDPMSAPERRLVHEYLRDRHDVETYSEGDEPERRLVIAPVLPD